MNVGEPKATLEISIGPVQSFVAQSRRTRDLWGSSFLLSFLAGHAMRGAVQAKGRMGRPYQTVVKDDPLYSWIDDRREGESPRIGTLPNHFVVRCDSLDQAHEAAKRAKAEFDQAWRRICKAVWTQYVEVVMDKGKDVQGIWERQVNGFWEFSWVAAEGHAKGLLARRKHWRTKRPSPEAGDKCHLLTELQELSGWTRYHEGAKQKEFWQKLSEQTGLGSLDIEENERLCAIALIKRLLPRVSTKAIGWPIDAAHWPSTDYVASVPWLRHATSSFSGESRAYAELVKKLSGADDIGHHKSFQDLPSHPLVRLNPDWYERSALRKESDLRKRTLLTEGLNKLCEVRNENGRLGGPPSYYAVLLADGDRLGSLVGKLGGKVVSGALGQFSTQALSAVRKENVDGVVVYAGGDDLLALLPVESALACADEIAWAYTAAFNNSEASLSAAVVYAHVRAPLSSILHLVHHLLDDVAKDGNGRNSLAAAVAGGAAEHCRWVTCWERSVGGDSQRAVRQIEQLRDQLKDGTNACEAGLSSSLIYRLRDLLSRLLDIAWEPGAEIELPGDIQLDPFFRAEVARSLEKRSGDIATREALDRLTGALVAPLTLVRGDKEHSSRITIDALLLAHFLAGGGREAEHL